MEEDRNIVEQTVVYSRDLDCEIENQKIWFQAVFIIVSFGQVTLPL